jgi:drug/metabolite transporter (DMT)-like permease
LIALGQTLLVTFLWATSWVLIKIGLDDLDLEPVAFAGLRYAVGAAVLLPFGFRAIRRARQSRGPIDRSLLVRVLLLGLVLYSAAQGFQFAALALLPAAAVGMVLATIPLWVGLIAWRRGEEAGSGWQAAGIAVVVVGAALYFGAIDLGAAGPIGLALAAGCALASTTGQHLARDLNRDAHDRLGGAVGLTTLSMTAGSIVLLIAGVLLEGWPELDVRGWLIVAWLAVVNTAFAFTLYNHALRSVTAVESSVIVNLLLVMVAGLAWAFLGEGLDARQVAGLALVTGGTIAVQLAPRLGRG